MSKLNLFCFGFGQVAKNFVNLLKMRKINFELTVTSRSETEDKKFENIKYQNFYFNHKQYDKDLIKNLVNSDHILVSIPPINGEDIVIENFKKNLEKNKYKWITYLSATSVYGNHNGEWVDENSKTNPTSKNGIERLKAERLWINLFKEFNSPVQIFRLSGIYSNQRNILSRLKKGEAKIIKKKNQFFSRIHIEDIASILLKSIKNFKKGEIYNISDDKPASMEEVTNYAIKLLGCDEPKTIGYNEIESEMLKNFYKDSKKVNNKKMKSVFNYKLKYPTFIEGLSYIKDNLI